MRHALKQAVIQGDVDTLEHLLDTMRGYDILLIDALAMLAEEFEYDKILALLRLDTGVNHDTPVV